MANFSVNDLLTGGCVVEEVKHLKETAIEIFGRAQFKLPIKELETSDPDSSGTDTDQSYAKQQLGVKSQETKLLGIPWNKTKGKIGVAFPCTGKEVAAKRTVLCRTVNSLASLLVGEDDLLRYL
ncbi:Hypothetical predicted protein [Paramuricea clavata]|uniref:Uncharacterized protein n=1 Tax=Paramuricea clavata TaxID=317549 RepID=A0A7D9I678_PARCT|nr:Hypothetical predicted protein [Paramuricea clavata]